jgi:hypothetical protein
MSFIVGLMTGPAPLAVSRARAQTNNPPGNGGDALTPELAKQKVDRLMAALEALNRKIDHSLFEIDALAQRLGSDPTTIFRFVRDEIRYEPYYGVLRGAQGTLISRAGNSLDRSLLEAALLQKAGYEVEIARGTLDQDVARELVARLWEPTRPVPSAMPSLEVLAPDLSKALEVTPEELLNTAAEMRTRREAVTKDLITYVNGESDRLLKELTAAGVNPEVVTTDDALIAEAREHYWVRYRRPGTDWTDLDPAFADAGPGKTRTAAEDHFPPGAVPEDRYHHLRVAVTLRTAQIEGDRDSSMSDTVMLDRELRVGDQQTNNIVLANQPNPVPDLFSEHVGLSDALRAIKGFQVVLQTGSSATLGKYFDLRGKVSETPDLAAGPATGPAGPAGFGQALGGLNKGLFGALGGSARPPEGSVTRIVGEWANYELRSPGPRGREPRSATYRRDILASQQASYSPGPGQTDAQQQSEVKNDHLRSALLWSVELLPEAGEESFDFVGARLLSSTLESRPAIDAILRRVNGEQTAIPPQPEESSTLLNILLDACLTDLTAGLTGRQQSRLRWYRNQPDLIAHEIGIDSARGQAEFERVDLVRLAPRAASLGDTVRQDTSGVFRDRIWRGVLAAKLEWAMLHGQTGPTTGNDITLNSIAVLQASRERGIDSAILKPDGSDAAKLSAMPIPDSIKAELSAGLAAGNILVVPLGLIEVGGDSQIAWWQIQPQTGEVLAVMPGSRGQAMVEKIIAQQIGVFLLFPTCGFRYGSSKKKNIDLASLMVCLAGGETILLFGTPALIATGQLQAWSWRIGTIIGASIGIFGLIKDSLGVLGGSGATNQH